MKAIVMVEVYQIGDVVVHSLNTSQLELIKLPVEKIFVEAYKWQVKEVEK